MSGETDLDALEAIYDALDRGDPALALERVRTARRDGPDDPVLRFLSGVALLELEQPAAAVDELRAAVEADEDDEEFRAHLALGLFRCCRFDEAAAALAPLGQSNTWGADSARVHGMLLERSGRLEEAERAFAEAARHDPERFPVPLRVDREEFHRQVEKARDHLPQRFRAHLDQVTVIVDDLPATELLLAEEPPLEPDLLGLFVGTAIGDESHLGAGGALPPQIYLFKRNLEGIVGSSEEMAEQIAVTLYHELGHYLGMSEDELEALDFG